MGILFGVADRIGRRSYGGFNALATTGIPRPARPGSEQVFD